MVVKIEGPLTKWTNVVQGWQYRWFVLDEHTGLLSYYTSKDKMVRGARRGCLRLKGAKLGINNEDDSTFTITCDHRTFHFQAQDSSERTKWVKCLEETIMKHGNQVVTSMLNVPSEEELNKRMQEAEAYFRLLTQQVKNLENQINHSDSPKSERSLLLKDSLTQMIETMGQTIELLHNAKITLTKKVPVPVIGNKPLVSNLVSDNKFNLQKRISDISQKSESSSASPRSLKSDDSNRSSGFIEVASDVLSQDAFKAKVSNGTADDGTQDYTHIETTDVNFLPEHVPINSYTSSDEEDEVDEFFDANDEFEIAVDEMEKSLKVLEGGDSLLSLEIAGIDNNVKSSEKLQDETKLKKNSSVHLPAEKEKPQESEYDQEDDGSDDGGGEDMQVHGSVITHLLSQVKIGMDLTKVTLPTFILERRSLLEMYADFFAHPDLFKGIPDIKDPGDRMLQVLRWYLSSFHAGRKGSVAKKPYNPILGEIFRCFYDFSDEDKKDLSLDGPIPWCTKDDVSFVAEQVSHHPPISAFYAECENKRICFNSHIWTKSKFLGLSIGVSMVGTGNVYVSDFDEEYIMTFPNGYGRSILTVPWVELGGKTEILCPRSGYSVQLEFHTKPFYGGKKNKVTAEVYAPGEKRSFMSVQGEWNGVMYSKYADAKEQHVFVDTFNMPTINKKVKNLNAQEEFESRRMWNDVTISLKRNLIDNASAAKHKLEEKQRQDARVRKETNTKWVTRVFDEWEESNERCFFYKWPLYKRLGLAKPGQVK